MKRISTEHVDSLDATIVGLTKERDTAYAAIRRLAIQDIALEQDLLHHVHEHDTNERQNRKYPGRVAKLRKLLSRLHTILKEDAGI